MYRILSRCVIHKFAPCSKNATLRHFTAIFGHHLSSCCCLLATKGPPISTLHTIYTPTTKHERMYCCLHTAHDQIRTQILNSFQLLALILPFLPFLSYRNNNHVVVTGFKWRCLHANNDNSHNNNNIAHAIAAIHTVIGMNE